MLKKIFFTFIFVFFLFTSCCYAQDSDDSATLKPLKVEQNLKKEYKYGEFDKTFSQGEKQAKTEFADILNKTEDKKEPSVLDVFNSLIFVIMLILLTGWIYMKIKKINPEQLLSGKFNKLNENTFKIVSSLQLGAGKAIYLIEINNKQLIVGTTSSSVNLLAQIDKQADDKISANENIEKLFIDKTEEFKKLEE